MNNVFWYSNLDIPVFFPTILGIRPIPLELRILSAFWFKLGEYVKQFNNTRRFNKVFSFILHQVSYNARSLFLK